MASQQPLNPEYLDYASERRSTVGWWMRRSSRRLVGRVLLYLVLIVGSLSFLFPFFYLLNMSVSSPAEFAKFPPDLIPSPISVANYWEGWVAYYPFTNLLENTILITLLAVIGQLLSCVPVAYGFARLRFPGRNFWFVVLLATMMLPSQVTLIPQYYIFAKLQWVNTFKPLIVPAYFGSAFYIFLLRQFFMTMPRELDDAARIDGCGYLRTLVQVLLPLCKPAVVAVAVFSFVGNWSDFFAPLIYLDSPTKYTMVLGSTMVVTSFTHSFVNMGYAMAVVTLTVVPVLIVYFWAQRYFIEGIALTGVRG